MNIFIKNRNVDINTQKYMATHIKYKHTSAFTVWIQKYKYIQIYTYVYTRIYIDTHTHTGETGEMEEDWGVGNIGGRSEKTEKDGGDLEEHGGNWWRVEEKVEETGQD